MRVGRGQARLTSCEGRLPGTYRGQRVTRRIESCLRQVVRGFIVDVNDSGSSENALRKPSCSYVGRESA